MKKVIITFIIILLTGCSAKYELEIRDDIVKEKSSFIMNKREMTDDSIYYSVAHLVGKYFLSADFLEGNTKEFYQDDKGVYQKLKNFTINSYEETDLINFAYEAYNVINKDDYILLTTSNKVNAFDRYNELEELDIVIKSNHKLIETNADEIGRYTYTWHVTRNNYDKKNIKLKLYKDKYVFNYNNEFIFKLLIIVVSVSLLFIIFFYMKRKNNLANKT